MNTLKTTLATALITLASGVALAQSPTPAATTAAPAAKPTVVAQAATPATTPAPATTPPPDSSTIQLQPFDGGSLGLIEKAISMSDLGLTCNNDGKVIRINIPPLTEDRRKELCKLASKYAEEGKVALRNIRRDAIDRVKKQEKEGELSEDQSRDEQDKVQKLTDRFITEIDKHLADKEADILKV